VCACVCMCVHVHVCVCVHVHAVRGEPDQIQKLIIANRMTLPQNLFQRLRKTRLPIRITTNFFNIYKMFYHHTNLIYLY